MGELETRDTSSTRTLPAGGSPRSRVPAVRQSAHASRRVSESARAKLKSEILPGSRNAIDEILRSAAQVLGVLTQELGVAIAPTLDGLVLERLELVRVSSERLLAVLTLQSGLVRTIFRRSPASVAAEVVEHVSRILNERLAGLRWARSAARCPSGCGDTEAHRRTAS
jgi:heat-inducible transcriptional repressor